MQIQRKTFEVFGGGAMNVGNVRKWYRLFEKGRTKVHDDKRSGTCLWLYLERKKEKGKEILERGLV